MRYLIILATIVFYGCPNNGDDCIANYTFEIPITVSPHNEILSVGDTLTVSMFNDNSNLYDSYGDRIVNYPNFDPNAWFLMPILDTFPVKDGLLENEVIIDENFETNHINVSTLSSGIFFLGIDTMDLESKLEFKVILNTPGTYALYSVSEIHRNSKKVCFPDKCNGCGYNTGYIIGEFNYTSEINNNILTTDHIANEDKYWIDRAGQRRESSPYYFKVVE